MGFDLAVFLEHLNSNSRNKKVVWNPPKILSFLNLLLAILWHFITFVDKLYQSYLDIINYLIMYLILNIFESVASSVQLQIPWIDVITYWTTAGSVFLRSYYGSGLKRHLGSAGLYKCTIWRQIYNFFSAPGFGRGSKLRSNLAAPATELYRRILPGAWLIKWQIADMRSRVHTDWTNDEFLIIYLYITKPQ